MRCLLAEESSATTIAATIVHEATHARLVRCGIGYKESIRSRVEIVCARRALASAAKLPDGKLVRENAQPLLDWLQQPAYAEYWTSEAFDKRLVEGAAQMLRDLGVPTWLANLVLALRALMMKLRMRSRPHSTF